ncbi:hypothetical protein [Nannocystis pusilla]|uniref:hypothetical protein n=1 Tax=Nannocystis pusilla TaxID=889268 RepID=UPI003B78FE01
MGDDLTGWQTTGTTDPVGPCGADPLCGIPPEEHEPTPKPDGLPSPYRASTTTRARRRSTTASAR